ncbi:MFS transporter [Streptomyces sp. B6B3]|uniref:MFS transporter n=1 Tax=Streptomyces sp. B6B3 TaxID=3153570 RepID=UPI00325C4806
MASAERGLGPAYWWVWTASALSNLADGVFKVAVPLLAVGLTRSPTLIAGLTFAFTLPWLLCALPAGALADRLDRRRLMVGANAVRAALLATLVALVSLDADSIAALYAVALCAGTAETVHDTAAQSLVPRLVPRDRLPRANGRLFAAELTANEFVGPPLAGLLVVAGAAVALGTPAALWALTLPALLLMRPPRRADRSPEPDETRPGTLRADILEGLRFLWGHRLLRTFAGMVGVFNFASSGTQAVLVLYAVGPASPMGLSAESYGWLLSTVAAGSLLGSFLAEPAERLLGRTRALVVSLAAAAPLVGLPAATADPFLVGAGFLVGGAGLVVANVLMVSLRQRATPDRLLGRVNSGYRLVAWGAKPLGALAGGVLAQLLGLRAVFLVMGLLALAVLAGLIRVTDDALAAAERSADRA